MQGKSIMLTTPFIILLTTIILLPVYLQAQPIILKYFLIAEIILEEITKQTEQHPQQTVLHYL